MSCSGYSQSDPVTRPNSALAGPPHLAQLRFVNAGLERNSHPREHYSRQFSVTPERQTPESQRTPLFKWPTPDPVEGLKVAKAWAANEAKRLERFYAGRVLLRKEEPERYGIFGEDTEYWYSQTAHWKAEYEKLAEEYDRRRQLEVEGKVVDGFAQSLLLSPTRSPSPPPPDGILRATAAGIKKHRPTVSRSSKQRVRKRSFSSHKKPTLQLSQHHYEKSLGSIFKASQKCESTEETKKLDAEDDFLARAFLDRGQTTGRIPKHSSKVAPKSAPRSRRSTLRVSKITTQRGKSPVASQAPRILPWTLRSRDIISYRETATRAASKKKRRPGRGKSFQGNEPFTK